MNRKSMIKKMARETGISIEEATKALNGLMSKGLIKKGSKKFPFVVDMDRVAEVAKGRENANS